MKHNNDNQDVKLTENLMVRLVHLSLLTLNVIIVTADFLVIGVCLHI
jgi:hypothetical protein